MRWVIIFLAGIVIGYGISQISPEKLAPISVPQQEKRNIQAPAFDKPTRGLSKQLPKQSPKQSQLFKDPLFDAIVRIEMFDQHGQMTSSSQGVIIGSENYLVLPVSVVKNAYSGKIFDVHGNQYALGNVISADSYTGLVAFRGDTLKNHSLRVSPNHSLYLGQEFLSSSLYGKYKGSIYSQPVEQSTGALAYTARISTSLDLSGSPLLESESGYLIGIVIENGSNAGEYKVVDSTAVISLIDSIFSAEPLSIAEFSRKYFEESPAGRLAKISSYLHDNKWKEVIELSEQLLSEDISYFNKLQLNLENSYSAYVKYLIGKNRLDEARAWLNRADSILGARAQRLILLSRIQQETGSLKEARSTLRRALALSPELFDSILTMIRRNVKIELSQYKNIGSDQRMIALLNEEKEYDDYSVYFYILGKAYYRNSDYEKAVENLSRAIYLDGKYEEEVFPIINAAKEKLNLPDLIEVPYTAEGKTIYVDVYINSSMSPFHFVLDTGASYTSISKEVADQLGLFINGNMVTLNTANGQITAPVINLESVNLNGAIIHNVLTIVLTNLGGIDGLLGLNFLKHFNMEMDQTNGKISLTRR